ncbi:MAG: hypothetical protein FWC00_03615 [Firmicutes bacterium]|nr:hypothetical protein [Bacillota bacterium]
MVTRTYRVECNHGSKYFCDIQKAFIYFQYKKAQGHAVEAWVITTERTKRLYSKTQELIDYAPKR